MSEAGSKKQDMFVSAVAPVLGGSETMTSFVLETAELLQSTYSNYELVLVDSASDEATIEKLMSLLKELACVRVIRLSQTANREIMIFAGLEAAIGDYVVVLMPPTDPPRVVADLVNIMASDHDIVFGLSEIPIRRSIVSQLGARLFYWYGRKYLGLNIPPSSTYLVGLNRRSINALTRIKGRYRHVRHLTRQVGFKSAIYHYTPSAAIEAAKERSFVESIRLAKEIVVSYSHHPLRVVSWLGLLASGCNLIYALYAISVYLFDRRVSEGWTTLSLELAVMFFLLFIILSVICEYIGRILEETRVQPAYHIMEELNSTVLVADETRRNVTQ
jgi:glycosyltransferase involved in cell wall biosynthesis